MAYGLTRISIDGDEPITLAQARTHLKYDDDDTSQDTKISECITAARELAETFCNRTLVLSTYRLTIPSFYDCELLVSDRTTAASYSLAFLGGTSDARSSILEIPAFPLISVTGVTYVDTDGVTQTWSSSNYQVDINDEPGRIAPVYGESWPVTRAGQLAAATITFTAGYAEPEDVPARVRQALYFTLTNWFEHPEGGIYGRGAAAVEIPFGAKALLQSAWIGRHP